jgi:hypothetical protein
MMCIFCLLESIAEGRIWGLNDNPMGYRCNLLKWEGEINTKGIGVHSLSISEARLETGFTVDAPESELAILNPHAEAVQGL